MGRRAGGTWGRGWEASARVGDVTSGAVVFRIDANRSSGGGVQVSIRCNSGCGRVTVKVRWCAVGRCGTYAVGHVEKSLAGWGGRRSLAAEALRCQAGE
jgi:hypothetical protein